MTNINKMDELGKNIPDDLWRKAFDEAAETPPPRVWDSIERRLNESNGPKVIPLWGSGLASSGPIIWGTGIAAALALLVVGWWAITSQSTPLSVAHRQPAGAVGNVASAPATSNSSTDHSLSDQSKDVVASVLTNKSPKALTPSRVNSSGQLSTEVFTKRPLGESMAQKMTRPIQKVGSLSQQVPVSAAVRTASAGEVPTPASNRTDITAFTASPGTATEGVTLNRAEVVAFKLLKGKSLRMRSPGPIQRIVWFQPAEMPLEAETIKQKHKIREKWASASVMPGAFNPMVTVQSAYASVVPTLIANTAKAAQSAVSSRANISMAYQASAGVQLTERWSVESGIGYLAGRSTVEAPIQSVTSSYVQGISADRTIVSNNLYVDALRNSSVNKLSTASANVDLVANNNAYSLQNNYNSQTRQSLNNDYQYMQVPIQVGYQLRPRKRLSLAVLGGLITNIFVRNTVGNDVVVTAKDGIYRPVSLAATMGARFRYRPSGHWSASLAGLYQPSLETGTRPESQVQSHPTAAGMSFGVDYHF